MKKNRKAVKIIVLICSCIMAAILLTSCNMLDELKEKRVDVLDGTWSMIEYRGTKYKKLPQSNYSTVVYNEDISLYCVEADVPLLFTERLGRNIYYCRGRDLLIRNFGYNGSLSIAVADVYCPLDKYEEYCEVLALESLNCYKFNYYERNTESGYYLEEKSYVFDNELTKIINESAAMGKKEKDYSSVYEDTVVITVLKCDEFDMVEQGSAYKLFKDKKGDYCLVVDEILGLNKTEVTFVRIPSGYAQKLNSLFEEYISADGVGTAPYVFD